MNWHEYADVIVNALAEEKSVSGVAKETAAGLIEGWIGEFGDEDAKRRIVAVECGFHIWLDPHTLVVGVQDKLAQDEQGYLGCEWKTAKEPKYTVKGEVYKNWNEDVWYEELTKGPQLGIYALAMKRGIYFAKDDPVPYRIPLNGANPRILVRAAVKASKPEFWPTPVSGHNPIREFPKQALVHVERGLLAKAATIRALREQPYVPWQLVGKQCFEFGRECQFYKTCNEHNPPEVREESRRLFFNPHDPAYTLALPFVEQAALDNPNLVILSASSYITASSCLEKFRILTGAGGDKDTSLALDVGTAFHTGVASFYRAVKGQQK